MTEDAEHAEELNLLFAMIKAHGCNTLGEVQHKRPHLHEEMSAILSANKCDSWLVLKKTRPQVWERLLTDWDGVVQEAMN